MLVDEHGRGKTRQATVVEMGGAPVILVFALARWIRRLRVVMQQPRLGGAAGADDVLEVPLWVSLDLLLGESITGTGDEDGDIDD